MANYVLVYKGGVSMPASEAEFQAQIADWGAWYGSLGDAVVDPGNPFGPSTVVSAGGAVTPGAPSDLTGYTILRADDLASASAKANGCPILAGGGSVEVYEVHEIM
jgi:hypothetical protein